MAVRTTHVVIEAIVPTITYSPTTPTGVGVSQLILEAIAAGTDTRAVVTQVVVEAIIPADPDGSTGGTGGGGSSPATVAFGYAV